MYIAPEHLPENMSRIRSLNKEAVSLLLKQRYAQETKANQFLLNTTVICYLLCNAKNISV